MDGEGEGCGGLWGVVPLCSSPLCGFTAKCSGGGPRLPLANRVSSIDSGDAAWRSKDVLHPASISASSVTISSHGDLRGAWLLFHFCFQISCEFLLVI